MQTGKWGVCRPVCPIRSHPRSKSVIAIRKYCLMEEEQARRRRPEQHAALVGDSRCTGRGACAHTNMWAVEGALMVSRPCGSGARHYTIHMTIRWVREGGESEVNIPSFYYAVAILSSSLGVLWQWIHCICMDGTKVHRPRGHCDRFYKSLLRPW